MNFTLNTLRPRQNGRHFADDMFKWIFLNENVWITIEISLKFVPKGSINNNPALFQIMAWRRPGDKPLSEPMMVSLVTHICVTRPQRVNGRRPIYPDLMRSISWLRMPWLLASPGHQHPCYGLYKTGMYFSYTRNMFIYQCHVVWGKYYKTRIHENVPLKNV